jgi:antitoxin component YwqK of YwqJK toxin-antitoxin module
MERRNFLSGLASLPLFTFILKRVWGDKLFNGLHAHTDKTDREQDGLRGPVKSCVEGTGKRLITTEYGVDGRLLTTRTSYAHSGWVNTNYYSGGHLVKGSSAKSGEPTTETLFAYDEAGKLKEIRHTDGKGNLTSSRYDQQGRWTHYDANGRVIEENQVQENAAPTFRFNHEQLEAINKAIESKMSGKRGTGRYDSQGRVIEECETATGIVTKTSYNERGDKSEERVTHNEEQTRITEYRYKYDQYGNWTERTTTHRMQLFHEAVVVSGVDRRTLTYF